MRDGQNAASGRDLIILKAPIVETELASLGVQFRPTNGISRIVSGIAYEAGGAVAGSFAINRAPGKSR
jgi:hypothetical protein